MTQLESPDDIYSWNLRELWNAYQQLLEEEDDNGHSLKLKYYELTKKIKHGINISIPIHYLINEWYTIYPTGKRVSVPGHSKYEITSFMDEKQERENLIRKTILENQEDDSNTEPR